MNDGPQRRFEVGACLGRGGYGEVYRASMVSPGGLATSVALKLVRSDLDVAPEALARLRDEARLLARLQHPNVVRVLDLCTVVAPDGVERIALVTELIEGRDLAGFIAGIEPMPIRAATEVMAAVCHALAAAWNTPGPDGKPMRVVHRDIKPSNVAIGRHGDIRVLDFGIASFEGEEREARTATAMLVGSLPYLAPERFLERGTRAPADVFAVGAVWYEVLAQEAWFAGISPRTLPGLAADRDRYEAWRWDRLQKVPGELRDVLAPLLAWDADSRPEAADLARRLEDVAASMSGPTLRSWCRTRSWGEPPTQAGALEGQTLLEGTGAPRTSSEERRAIAPPTVVRKPLSTVNSSSNPSLEAKLRDLQGVVAGHAPPPVPPSLSGSVAPAAGSVAPRSSIPSVAPVSTSNTARSVLLGCGGATLIAFVLGALLLLLVGFVALFLG